MCSVQVLLRIFVLSVLMLLGARVAETPIYRKSAQSKPQNGPIYSAHHAIQTEDTPGLLILKPA